MKGPKKRIPTGLRGLYPGHPWTWPGPNKKWVPFLRGLLFLALLPACTIKPVNLPEPTTLPQHVYCKPVKNYLRQARVGIFPFDAPSRVSGVGFHAANILYQHLLERGAFKQLYPEFGLGYLDPDQALAFCKKRNYDLMITGRVSYYLEGSMLQPSRVDEQIWVTDVKTKEPLWYAQTVEVGEPIPTSDYIFFQVAGESAPTPMALMAAHARRACKMLLWVSPHYERLPGDMKLNRDGYHYLLLKDYDKARTYFERAIQVNPDNAFALLNLGVVAEAEGNTEKAAEIYVKVIDLKDHTVVTETNVPHMQGLTIAEIAQRNLKRLKPPCRAQ